MKISAKSYTGLCTLFLKTSISKIPRPLCLLILFCGASAKIDSECKKGCISDFFRTAFRCEVEHQNGGSDEEYEKCSIEALQGFWEGCLGSQCGAILPDGSCDAKCTPALEEAIKERVVTFFCYFLTWIKPRNFVLSYVMKHWQMEKLTRFNTISVWWDPAVRRKHGKTAMLIVGANHHGATVHHQTSVQLKLDTLIKLSYEMWLFIVIIKINRHNNLYSTFCTI